MNYDIYIFDLDGTLTDPKIGITNSYLHALAEFGMTDSVDTLSKFIGPPLRDVFANHYGFSETDTEKAVTKFREYFGETGKFENVVYPGIFEMLQKLKDNGKILAVATNKVKKYAEEILEHFNLAKYFDCISGDDMEGALSKNGKSEIIRIALEAVDPERKCSAVMIGDRKNDIHGANEVGIDSIGVLWSCYGSREELETAGATVIIDRVEELLRRLRCLGD